ncbi:phospholipase [Veronia nyctiphanis]|uniref:Phospholipase n=1 Tax=Veronia nyctiphanis TaxID=1278244 RepID=A0A4Q0YZK0_9GAMM|nr:Mbeg1-like protein [Veronia nyctiphanis]RXJ74581.1 phospholipase [Veronia nyctiphanis]
MLRSTISKVALSASLLLSSANIHALDLELLTEIDDFIFSSYLPDAMHPNYDYSDGASSTTIHSGHPDSATAQDALFYLEFAEKVHNWPIHNGNTPDGWKALHNFSDTESGFDATFYLKKSGITEGVLAFRGSELGVKDWITNGEMAAGLVPDQYMQAINAYKEVRQLYPTVTDITFTGHSLGGGLATAAAIYSGYPAYAYDASGIGKSVLQWIKKQIKEDGRKAKTWKDNARNIKNFNLENEFVSDKDSQQDADTLGDSRQHGDIWYISDDGFVGILVMDFTRHFTTPLKEELVDIANGTNKNGECYWDWVGPLYLYICDNDDLETLAWTINFTINGLQEAFDDLNDLFDHEN